MSTTGNMTQSPLHLRVFLASPGDVAEERKLALQVLWDLQHDPFLRGYVTLEAVAWDYPSGGVPMLAAMSAQDAVTLSRGKPSECDIVVVILWSRLGSPIQEAMYAKLGGNSYYTGTEWEYEDAWQAAKAQGKPHLLLYHRTEELTLLGSAGREFILEQLEQFEKVKAFCGACHARDGSIAKPYDKPSDFAPILKEQLREIIHQVVGLQQRPVGPDLRLAEAEYLNYLLDRHQYLSLKGMGLSERVPLQERGTALVLLDGLDEVQDNNLRHLVVERVADFYTLHRKAGNKFVITSRIIGYRDVRPVATGLAECTLVDFNDEEIKTFVDRWTQALEKQAQGDTRLALADAERERGELLAAVERNTGVRQLAANPLLLMVLSS